VTARTEPSPVAPLTTSPDHRTVVREAGRRTWTQLRRSGLARAVNRRVPLVVARSVLYYRHEGRLPRILGPQTFTEKVTWRICFDRRPLLAWTCDKLRMKEEARRRDPVIGVPRTLWHGTDLAELAALDLPDRWVLKANHASRLVHLGHGQPSVAELERITAGWLGPSFQEQTFREWAYARAARCLLVEEWIGDERGASPSDLKFFCFDGQVSHIEVHVSRFGADHAVSAYDPRWVRLPVRTRKAPGGPDLPAPENLPALLEHATRLSAGFDFIRVDLYDTERGVFFGEFTPYPSSGLMELDPPSFDRALGARWTLPAVRR
jgi:TupA-like ATPgrasp